MISRNDFGGDSFGGNEFEDEIGVFDSGLVNWDESFMRQALGLAEQAMQVDEVPVGAIVVHGNRVIGSGWNQRESLKDPTAHAEMIGSCDTGELEVGRMHAIRDFGALPDVRWCHSAVPGAACSIRS